MRRVPGQPLQSENEQGCLRALDDSPDGGCRASVIVSYAHDSRPSRAVNHPDSP